MDRARGAFYGHALGDAYGMATEGLSRAAIAASFGPVDRLLNAAGDHPLGPGRPAGSVTDDTEQAMLVAGLLIEGGGRVAPRALADALLSWEASMRARGRVDLLGPSTAAALLALASGASLEDAGRAGTTNGAAMRATPIGIAFAPGDALLDAVVSIGSVTHGTGVALAGAAAVAGVVSCGVEGRAWEASLAYGLDLAKLASGRGRWVAAASVAERTRWALAQSPPELADFLDGVVGTSLQTQESVVAALVIADRFRDAPLDGVRFAAGLGGDTDTMAALAGAMLGAHHGLGAWPAEDLRTVGLDLEPLVAGLLALR